MKKTSSIFTPFSVKKTKLDWNKVFEDLINGGLKRVLVVIIDDSPVIIETVKAVYPYADHQLCFVDLQRNIRKYMTKADATEFNKELDKIRLSFSFYKSIQKFYNLCSKFKSKYSNI